LEKVTVVVWFWKFLKISPTCPKFNTHKKVVLHFFILMLLLPKTPSSTYPKTKNLKDQKSITFFSLSLTTKTFGFGLSGGGGRRRGEMASSLTIRESFKGKYSTCKTSAGIEFYKRNPFNFFLKSQSIFKRNPIKKNRLQFYMKNPM